jgi:hypothetical protein
MNIGNVKFKIHNFQGLEVIRKKSDQRQFTPLEF